MRGKIGRWTLASAVVASLALAGCAAPGGGPAPATPIGTVVAVPTPAAATPGAGGTPVNENPAVQAAIADLAKQRGADPARISVVTVEAVEWPDAGLGCPQPGRAYAQVITPGYRVTLGLDGQSFRYHTNRSGSALILCQRP